MDRRIRLVHEEGVIGAKIIHTRYGPFVIKYEKDDGPDLSVKMFESGWEHCQKAMLDRLKEGEPHGH